MELLPPVLALLERRRLADTLLPGKCALHEVEWMRRLYAAAGATAEMSTSVNKFVGYESYLKAAQLEINAARYPAVFALLTAAQKQKIFSCSETAVNLMTASSTYEFMAFNYEALLLDVVRCIVERNGELGHFDVSGMHYDALAAALGRLEASGVIEEREMVGVLQRIDRDVKHLKAKAKSDVEARGLLACAHCGAREVHVAQFKRCSACKSVVFCCKDCQLANWPSHKAACKAARKAAAGAAAGA